MSEKKCDLGPETARKSEEIYHRRENWKKKQNWDLGKIKLGKK